MVIVLYFNSKYILFTPTLGAFGLVKIELRDFIDIFMIFDVGRVMRVHNVRSCYFSSMC